VALFSTLVARPSFADVIIGGLQARDLRLEGAQRLAAQLNEAKQSLRQGDPSKCRALVDAYCDAHSDTPHRSVLLVCLYLEEQKEQGALDVLAEMSLDPRAEFESHFAFARVAARQGRWQDAWAHLRVAELAKRPIRWSAAYKQSVQQKFLEVKAIIAMGRSDWKTAHVILSDLVKTRPNDPEGLRSLAGCAFHMDDLANAEKLFRQAAELDKQDDLPFQVRLATLYLETDAPKSSELAESSFKEGIEALGKSGQLARLQYAAWLQQENRAMDVLSVVDKETFDKSLLREQEYLRGLAHRMLGDYQAAGRHFQSLYRLEPTNLRISNQLALVLVESDDMESRDQALRIAEQNANRVKTEATLSTLAWIRFKRGNVAEAQKLLAFLVNRDSISRDVAYYTSEVLRANKRDAESDQMLKVARESAGPFYYQHRLAPPPNTPPPKSP
jgi:Flp pilus assembly protein TadD